jgi:hypothetical protein
VNSVNFELSNWDIKMRMGQIQTSDPATLNIGEVVRVFMSHTHARAFAAALNTVLAKMDAMNAGAKPAPSKTAH